MKVTYTEEAVADIVQAITFLNERNPTAATKLDADIARCIERLAIRLADHLAYSPEIHRVARDWTDPVTRLTVSTLLERLDDGDHRPHRNMP